MEYTLLMLYIIVTILLLCITFLLIKSFTRMLRKDFVPFVPIPTDALVHLIQALQLNEKSTLYDLGCGDGKIIAACYDICPNATYIGIEKELWPYYLGRLRHRKKLSEKFNIIRGDLFNHTYADATHITLYLFPFLMDVLLPKLEKELCLGTKVFSIDFPFSKKQYTDIIHINDAHKITHHKIYVYKF